MVHLIHYELKGYRSRADYERLGQAIKNISGIWCHTPESTWLIETELSTQQVRDRIAPLTFVGDPLMVIRVQNDWASYSLTTDQVTWLQGRNFSSVAEMIFGLLPLPKVFAPAFTLSKALGGR